MVSIVSIINDIIDEDMDEDDKEMCEKRLKKAFTDLNIKDQSII
jgi:hypothetical protein